MSHSPKTTITEIAAGRGESGYWRDVWKYRDLFFFLAWRDLAVRYKQTAVGVAWALVQPAVTLVVFTIFGHIVGTGSDGAPRTVFVFAGLLPWQLFAAALGASAGSLLNNAQLVTKVYFPRLIIPASAVITATVDFLIALGLYLAVAVAFGATPDWRIVALPLFIVLAMVVALGAGLWIAALNVKYRDFRFVLPMIIQLGLYVAPIAIPTSEVPADWLWLYRLNPIVGLIDGFRWSLLGGATPVDLSGLSISLAAAAMLLTTGIAYFRATERRFADFI